jgi:hypothetical protein
MSERSPESRLTVRNEYETVLSSNFYRHRVYVNGHYKGSAAPNGGELHIDISSGTFRLKTRQFFYFSPTFEGSVLPNESLIFTTNVNLKHKLRLFFMPWCALILELINSNESRD